MQGEPYDELVTRISGIIADLIAGAAREDMCGEVRCIMITSSPEAGGGGGTGEDEPAPIEYELVESGEYWYVTARLPTSTDRAAYVDIQKDRVRICVGRTETVVPLNGKADLPRSFYDVRHGIVDVTVHKCPKKEV